MEPILIEWEAFARGIWPDAFASEKGSGGASAGPAELRDDAEAMLRSMVADMASDQTLAQQSDKSMGKGRVVEGGIDHASEPHGVRRVASGFDIAAVVAEYRALRASVLRLWRDSGPKPDMRDLDDLTRFNESMDQSLAQAVHSYVAQVKLDRDAQWLREHEARSEAEAANRAKDIFLATLSHEMRTPLNAIVGWMQILRTDPCNPDELTEGLDVIERSTLSQVQLIEDILDVSRIVSGKLHVNITPCDLVEAVEAGIDAVRSAADARGITLAVRLDPSARSALCDATRIQQVVWNLVSNAAKFTPNGGRIDVTLTREDSSLQIQVSDNGEGISADLLPYVFERFRQADTGSRRKFGGLGLGLSIVKHIVEQHGGTVEAESAGMGLGSTFTVRLPVRAVRDTSGHADVARDFNIPEAEAALPKCQPLVAGNTDELAKNRTGSPLVRLDGLKVLIVDDEADARRIMVKVLEQAGAVVTAAAGAAEALGSLTASLPDILVSDLGMPGEDGIDLIRQVRARGFNAEQLPAVALTAFVQKDYQRNAMLAGFQVHMGKPVDPQDLTAVIATLAGHGDVGRGMARRASH